MDLTIQQFLAYYFIIYLIELLFMVSLYIREGEITATDLLEIIIIPLSIIVIPIFSIIALDELLQDVVIWRNKR